MRESARSGSRCAIIVQLASTIMPAHQRERFRQEWLAELDQVRAQRGRWDAARFSFGLFSAAIQVTRVVRKGSSSAYLEIAVASISALPSTLILALWAASTSNVLLLGAQLAIGIGILLFAAGIWSSDGLFLSSTYAQIGLALVVVGSAVSTSILRTAELPFTQRISPALPNTVVVIGLAMLVCSNYAGRHRSRFQLGSLYLLVPGAVLTAVVAVINAREMAGLWRAAELVYAVPSAMLAWACLSIARRRAVFPTVNRRSQV